MNPEVLYMQLGRLAENVPDLGGVVSDAIHQWLGKLDALLAANDDTANLAQLRASTSAYFRGTTPGERWEASQEIKSILYRAFAAAELHAPVSAQGSFIPAGNALDALAAIGKILQMAKRDVLIVDPYMDEKALTDFAPLAAASIETRLLADEQMHKPTLTPAKQRWVSQYGAKRPLEARLASPKVLHDRLIIVDEKDTFVLTQSLNAFAARSPAAVVRVDGDTSILKVGAYAKIWAASKPL